MYGIFTYIWLIFMVNVGKHTIHGWYGYLGGKDQLKLLLLGWLSDNKMASVFAI